MRRTWNWTLPGLCLALVPLSWGAPAAAAPAVGSRIPYQVWEELDCAGSGECEERFDAVPERRRLEITDISCELILTVSSVEDVFLDLEIAIVQGNNVRAVQELDPRLRFRNTSGQVVFIANAQTRLIARAGQRPQFFASVVGGYELVSCRLTGDLVVTTS